MKGHEDHLLGQCTEFFSLTPENIDKPAASRAVGHVLADLAVSVENAPV